MLYENHGELKESSELKALSREQLNGKWLTAVLVCFIAYLLVEVFTSGYGAKTIKYVWENGRMVRIPESEPGAMKRIGRLINFILAGPIYFGVSAFFMKLVRKQEPIVEDMFIGFKSMFLKTFVLNLIIEIFTFLWMLLLIIPGIIAMLRYSMAYYIMVDNPEVDALYAIEMSKKMMDGNKSRLFGLWCSFIGWFLLGLITCGIGFLWITPYYRTAKTNFYEDLKIHGY